VLLKQGTLAGIANGSITLVFRRWRRPTVKAGGTLLTAVGQLTIDSVERITLREITKADAVAAGLPNLASLRSQLKHRDGDVYRVRLHLLGPDPRVALRDRIPDDAEWEELVEKLRRLDVRSSSGPWTRTILKLIGRKPAVLAADLAKNVGMEKADFKVRLRKLKTLGLTESLKVGYRLSPRGNALLKRPCQK
jgi:hypothetical protein